MATNEVPSEVTSDEIAPLLSNEPPTEADARPRADIDDDTPMPKTQIFVLCFARILEPIAFFSIFSFINKMVWETGNVKKADVGFYSGVIESLFSLTQMLVMLPWGRAADRFGRKPILVLSLTGVTIASTLFGFSQAIWQMIVIRCVAGVFAGTMVTLQTLCAEITSKKTQARAFSFLSISSNLGILVGPFIGGILCNPTDQYPGLFKGIQFFETYPYALPTIGTGALGAIIVISTAVFVKETLHTKANKGSAPPAPPLSTLEVVRSPGVIQVLVILAMIMILAYGYTAIVPLFCFTDVALGGFGFSPIQISGVMGVGGVMQTLYAIFAFPPLQHRFGTVGILRTCAFAWPVFFLVFPIANLLLRHDLTVAFWIFGSISLVIGSALSMAFTAIQLAINDISPTPLTLGTLNALALMSASGLRAIAPALFSSIFAIGVRYQILSGYLVWLILVILGIGLAVSVNWLPEKAYGRIKSKSNGSGGE